MKIHLLPMEPIEARYSADWYRWWPEQLRKRNAEVIVYDGQRLRDSRKDSIKHGEWLDALDTHYYKSTQLARFIEALDTGKVEDCDIVLLLEGYNPVIESLAYMRLATGIRFIIASLFHGGTWDEWDYLSQRGAKEWIWGAELSWLTASDLVLVATDYHRNMIAKHVKSYATEKIYNKILNRIKVTGFPLELSELDRYRVEWNERKNVVVFPHRLAKEKGPEIFKAMELSYKVRWPNDGTSFVRTAEMMKKGASKEAYYRQLAKAKVVVSCAFQETWGIAQLEGWYLGGVPVVPDRISYRELYPACYKYSEVSEAVHLIKKGLERSDEAPFVPQRKPEDAWDRIIDVLKSAEILEAEKC